jgi:spore coat polysaccharide biosynthesis protein SpsF
MKTGFFITARLKSTRLKHKILLNLNGKSVLDHVIERCKITKGIDDVVLCTSTNPEDSILFDFALKNQIKFYAGSENDVMDRLLSAALYYGFDSFLTITADNPLFSIYTSQLIAAWGKKENFDFIFTKGIPVGCATTYIDVKALQISHAMKVESDTEIWGPFINRSDFFKIGELVLKNSPFMEEKRITCDYPEDYQFFRAVYSYFDKDYIPDIHEVFEVLIKNPDLWEINKKLTQRYLSKKELNKINENFDKQAKFGKELALKINKNLNPELKKSEVFI